MIHRPIVNINSNKSFNTFIKWITPSSPRPIIGIEGILYVNRESKTFYIWDNINEKYIEFFNSFDTTKSTTTNNSSIVESTNENNNSYSFNLVNDILIISDSNNEIVIKIPIPNEDNINKKINELDERITKIEELLD